MELIRDQCVHKDKKALLWSIKGFLAVRHTFFFSNLAFAKPGSNLFKTQTGVSERSDQFDSLRFAFRKVKALMSVRPPYFFPFLCFFGGKHSSGNIFTHTLVIAGSRWVLHSCVRRSLQRPTNVLSIKSGQNRVEVLASVTSCELHQYFSLKPRSKVPAWSQHADTEFPCKKQTKKYLCK